MIALPISGAECCEHPEADRAHHRQRQEAGGALHLGHHAGIQVRVFTSLFTQGLCGYQF